VLHLGGGTVAQPTMVIDNADANIKCKNFIMAPKIIIF
jgi:hypothetical protein